MCVRVRERVQCVTNVDTCTWKRIMLSTQCAETSVVAIISRLPLSLLLLL